MHRAKALRGERQLWRATFGVPRNFFIAPLVPAAPVATQFQGVPQAVGFTLRSWPSFCQTKVPGW